MLITDFDELRRALEPILRGDVEYAGFDTETSEIHDDRFTPFGTDSRIAGFSISYDLPPTAHSSPAAPSRCVDLYSAVRHRPYDYRRRRDLIQADVKHDGPDWIKRLDVDEGISPEGLWLPGWDPNLPIDEVRDLWREVFAVEGVIWRAHNWPFDAKMLLAEGVEIPWDRIEDTQVLSVFTDERPLDLWNEEENGWVHKGHGLKHLGEEYLGIDPEAQRLLKEAIDVLDCKSYAHLPLRTIVAPYGAMDTRLCLNLGEHIHARPLAQDPAVLALIREHHKELRRVVEMESRGVCIDVAEAARAAEELEREQGRIRIAAREVAGRQIALDSPAALEVQLYDDFGLPTYRENRDTRKATLKQVRSKVASGVPLMPGSPISSSQAIAVLDHVLDYRKVTKELTAFYRPLTDFGEDGVIYTILNPLRARTTRYSAAKPNVQQMPKPKKGEEATSVRRVFKPRPGHVFLHFDYSQQELRVGTHYAQAIPEAFQYRFTWRCTLKRRGDCKGRPPHGEGEIHVGYRSNWSRRPKQMALVEGFLSGDRSYDPHQTMVERCIELAIEIDRNRGKMANFALIYGAGIFKLMEILDCSWEFAKKIFDTFWNVAYPELNRVKEFIGERLRQHGPRTQWSHQRSVRTLHGAHVFLDGAHKGLNYIIQRSCREILLKAINSVGDYLEEEAPTYKMVFPVHDELVLEVPEEDVDQGIVRNVCRLMVKAGAACSIPMIVDPAISRENWAVKEDLDPDTWGWNGVTDGVG